MADDNTGGVAGSGGDAPDATGLGSDKAGGNYFVRHWRGELPLAQSYWVNTVGINWLLRMLIVVVGQYSSRLPLLAVPVLIFAIWSTAVGLLVWQATGVLRAAFLYEERTGKAQYPVFVGLSILLLGATSLFGFVMSGLPQLSDAVNILQGDPQLPNPVITVLPSGREIEFRGMIKLHSAAQLDFALNGHPAVTVLHLDTPGGREREAVAMADVVRRHHLSTYVDQTCASAGIIVFLAGKERTLQTVARLGFHSAHAAGSSDASANGEQTRILSAAGVSADFIKHVVDTPPDSLWVPEHSELVSQGIVTRISDGAGFNPGTRAVEKYNAKGISDELTALPEWKALAEREPEKFARGSQAAAGFISKGSDVASSLGELKRLLEDSIRDATRSPSDEAVEARLELDLEVISRNMYRDPKATLQWVLRVAGAHVPDFPDKSYRQYLVVLLASPKASGVPLDATTYSAEAISSFLECAKARNKDFAYPYVPYDREDQVAMCEILNDFLSGLRKLPPDSRIPQVRYYYSRILLQQAGDGKRF